MISPFSKVPASEDFVNDYTREIRAACALLESGRPDEAVARYKKFMSRRVELKHTKENNRESLEMLCRTRKQLREQCIRFREGGIEAVFEEGQKLPDDPAELKRFETHFREGCRRWLID